MARETEVTVKVRPGPSLGVSIEGVEGEDGEDGERKEDQHRTQEMQELGRWQLFSSSSFANVFL